MSGTIAGTIAIGYVMGWTLASPADSSSVLALAQATITPAINEVRTVPKCPECGMVVSMREIEAHGEDAAHDGAAATTPPRYEIIVRLADGSERVIREANPARWRVGERVVVIADTDPPQP